MTDSARRDEALVSALLVVRDAPAAIDFYTKVFGAVEQWRLMHFHRVGHAVLRIGGSEIALLDEFPEAGIVGPANHDQENAQRRSGPRLMLQVPDVDDALSKARQAGATVIRDAEDQWWGVRSGAIVDPFGYQWGIHSIVEPISIEEMQRRADDLGLYPPPAEAPSEPAPAT